MRNVLVRTASGVVYIALMVAAVFTQWAAVPLAFFFAFVGIYEFYRLCNEPELRQSLAFWIITAGCVLDCFLNMEILAYRDVPSVAWMFLLGVAWLCLFVPELIGKSERAMSHVGLGFLSQMWIVLPLCLLFFLWMPQSPEQALAFLILIWMSDTAAYVCGSLFGKHKLAPNISPGKTWEGFIGSCILTALAAWLLSLLPYFQMAGLSLWQWIVFALIIEVIGLLGDLTESLFKRKAGVKDSGNIIPGHGGVLDRLDSILFASPVAFIFCLLCTK